jgi:hypothetical protein
MSNRDPYDTTPGLLMEQAGWTQSIERSLEGVSRDRQQAGHAARPESREGWLVVERALRYGAAVLKALPQPRR